MGFDVFPTSMSSQIAPNQPITRNSFEESGRVWSACLPTRLFGRCSVQVVEQRSGWPGHLYPSASSPNWWPAPVGQNLVQCPYLNADLEVTTLTIFGTTIDTVVVSSRLGCSVTSPAPSTRYLALTMQSCASARPGLPRLPNLFQCFRGPNTTMIKPFLENDRIVWHDRFSRNDPDLAPKYRRRRPPRAIVLHTTGYGDGLKRIDAKYSDDATVDQKYSVRLDQILKYKCEFLVGRLGTVYRMTKHETHIAYHTGRGNRERLGADFHPPAWWYARHPGLEGPLDLPSWRHGSPNSDSIGIDILAPRGGGAAFSAVQRDAVIELVAYLTCEHKLLIDHTTVVDHSSLDPIERARHGKPWDLPDSFDLEALRADAMARARRYGMDYSRRACINLIATSGSQWAELELAGELYF